MSYISKDEQILIKIQKNMKMLKRVFGSIEHLSVEELDESVEAFALSQCITNLFELSGNIIDDAVAAKLNLLSSARIMRFRNIAAHDYESINWDIARRNCRTILSAITDDCINECFDILAEKKANTKDYTQISNDPYQPPEK